MRPERPFADNDVLSAPEMRGALSLSPRQWARVAPALPHTYILGKKSPRYIYGDVVQFLRKHCITPVA